MAKREKQPVHHVQMTDGKSVIIQELLQEYDTHNAQASLSHISKWTMPIRDWNKIRGELCQWGCAQLSHVSLVRVPTDTLRGLFQRPGDQDNSSL